MLGHAEADSVAYCCQVHTSKMMCCACTSKPLISASPCYTCMQLTDHHLLAFLVFIMPYARVIQLSFAHVGFCLRIGTRVTSSSIHMHCRYVLSKL